MKLIRYVKRDGYRIVREITPAIVDPRETDLAAKAAIDESPEALRLVSLLHQAQGLRGAPPQETHFDLALEAVRLQGEIQSQYHQRVQNNPVFCIMPDAMRVSDEDAEKWEKRLASLSPTEALTADGLVIPNLVGHYWWEKTEGQWECKTASRVGEPLPAGATLAQNLTADQRAEIKKQQQTRSVRQLSSEERGALKKKAKYAAKQESVKYKADLEIEGFSPEEALEKARRKFQEKVEQIDEFFSEVEK